MVDREWWSVPSDASDVELDRHWGHLSRKLLLETIFHIGGVSHRILEIELYFHSKKHPDPYCHKDAQQRTSGQFYFHKQGKSYRGGTYKGLDLSIGLGDNGAGGVLIRTLQNMESGEIICGPSKCVDHILSLCKATSIQQLVDEHLHSELDIFQPDAVLRLSPSDVQGASPKEVHSSVRVGLYLNKKDVPIDIQKLYLSKRYRYTSRPDAILKGRVHWITALYADGHSLPALRAKLNYREDYIKKIVDLYEKGTKMNIAKFYNKRDWSDSDLALCVGSLFAEQRRSANAVCMLGKRNSSNTASDFADDTSPSEISVVAAVEKVPAAENQVGTDTRSRANTKRQRVK